MPSRALTVIPTTRKQWAKRINDRWRDAAGDMLAAVFGIGRDLIQAKKHLAKEFGRGEFMLLVKEDLIFGHRTANMMMVVAACPRFQNWSHGSIRGTLPPHWRTLYEITRLTDLDYNRLLKDGTIRPDMERSEVSKVLRIESATADENRVLQLEPIVGKFRTIVIDPAWEYEALSLAGRAKPDYAMQSVEELHELDVRAWADEEVGCQLYCWTTNNFMAEACKLVAHWGFQHRTVLTWIKPPPFGLGSYFRNSTEHVLFATLGETTTRHAAASIPTHFEAPRGEHSEKPEQFYDIVRAASYPPFGEANQREPRPDFVNLFVSREVISEAAAE
jgi:N6-adenosine-specific RNA methylase IME4